MSAKSGLGSRGLSGKKCLECCEGNQLRVLLKVNRMVLELIQLFQTEPRGDEMLRNPGDVVIFGLAKAPLQVPPELQTLFPEGFPLEEGPFYRLVRPGMIRAIGTLGGYAAIVIGSYEVARLFAKTEVFGAMNEFQNAFSEGINTVERDIKEDCTDCVKKRLWSQKNKQKTITETIRRRV